MPCRRPLKLTLLIHFHTLTTENVCFAEGLRICRGPNLEHSAKTLFAEGQPQEPSAKNGHRQIKSLPRAAALGKDALGKLGPLGHGGHSRQALPRATR